MKRRTFVLWGGALGTISLSLTATSAAFTFDVSPVSDFRVTPREPDAFVDVTDNSENTVTTHNWTVEAIRSTANVDTIAADYPTGTSFANVTDKDVTIEFRQADGAFNEIKLDKADYTGSNATFNITDNKADLLGEARIEIVGIENPSAETYTPSLTFTAVDGNSTALDAEMGISSDAADFRFLSYSIPDKVAVGNTLSVSYEIENINTELGSKSVVLNIDGTQVDENVEELGGGESTTGTLTYISAAPDDTPNASVEVDIKNDDSSRSKTVAVGGEFGFDLSTYKQNQDAIHTWSTGFLDSFDGDVDQITVEYSSAGGGNGNGNGNNKGFDLSGLTSSDVTVQIERSGDSTPTAITVVNTSTSGSAATFSLDPNQATDIDGDVVVEVDSIKNPKDGDYDGTITLGGDDTYTETVPFSITK